METRKYSYDEIARMRAAVGRIFISRWLPGADAGETAKVVEDQLRTYMMNGTEPEELEQAATVAEASRAEERKRASDSAQAQILAGHGKRPYGQAY